MHHSKIVLTFLILVTLYFGAKAQTTTFSNEDTKINIIGNTRVNVFGDFRQNRTDTMNTIYGLSNGACLDITGNLLHQDAFPFSYTNDALKLTLNGAKQYLDNTANGGQLNFPNLTIATTDTVWMLDSIIITDELYFTLGRLSLNGHNLLLDDLDNFLGNNDDPTIFNESENKRIIGNGKIRVNEAITNFGSTLQNVAGMGATLLQNSANQINLERTHHTQDIDIDSPGDESIALTYFIETNSTQPAEFTFHYFKNMMDPIDEANLNFYRSEDGDKDWVNEGISVIDPFGHSATESTIDTLSPRYWTLSPCVPPAITLSHGDPDGYICEGDSITFTATHQADWHYLWSSGEEGLGVSQITVKDTDVGPEFFTVKVTNSLGCFSEGLKGIETLRKPQVNIVLKEKTLCESETFEILPNYANLGSEYSFEWNSGSTDSTLTVTGDGSSNTDTLIITVYSWEPSYFLTSCETSDTILIHHQGAPIFDLGGNLVECDAPNTTLSTGLDEAIYSFQWETPSATFNTPTITATETGEYRVTVTDGSCLFKDTLQVYLSDLSSSIIASVAECHPDDAPFWDTDKGRSKLAINMNNSGIAPFTVTYDDNQTAQFSTNLYDLYVDSTGMRTILITDDVGCVQSIDVNILQGPSAMALNATIQHAHCALNSGAISLNPTGGTPGYNYNWGNSFPGVTGPVVTNVAANGFYEVYVNDQNGCEIIGNFDIEGPSTLLEATASATTIFCAGSKSTATVSAQFGTPPYTYSLDGTNFQTSNQFADLSAGNYTFTTKDNYACIVTTDLVIDEPAPITASATTTNTSCNGGNDGSITVNASGGTGALGYSIMGGQTFQPSPVFDDLSAGVYNITIIDQNGCYIEIMATVNNNSSIVINETIVDDLCRTGMGSINLSPTGGAGNYTYNWSTGSTNCCLSNLMPGDYTVTVSDANACDNIAMFNIAGASNALAVNANHLDVSCNGSADGSVTLSALGGSPAYQYALQGQTFSSNPQFDNLAAGSYTFQVKDANDCTKDTTITIAQPLAISFSESLTQVTCRGESNGAIDLTITASNPYTIAWSNGEMTEDLNSLSAGTYTVTVTYNNISTCNKIQNFTITEPNPFTFNPTLVNDFCDDGNGNITLNPAGGSMPYTFNWSDGPMGMSRPNLNAGIYGVTLSDGQNCMADTTIQLFAPNSLTATVNSTDPTCTDAADGSISVNIADGTPPYRFQLNSGAIVNVTGTSHTATDLPKGTYNLTILDSKDCSFNLSRTLSDPPALSLSANTGQVSCAGGTDGSIELSPTGGTGNYMILWNDGSTSTDRNNLSAGVYTVTVSTSSSCSVTASYTITEPNSLSANEIIVNDDCLQDAGSIQLVPTGGTPLAGNTYSYLWNTGATMAGINNLNAGTYSVTITDANNCTLVKNIMITSPTNILTATGITIDVNCASGMDGSINLTASGGTSPYTFLWSNGASTQNLTALSAGTYTVTVTDAKNCTTQNSFTINQPNALNATANTTDASGAGVSDGAIDVTASGGELPYTFNWSNGSISEDLTGIVAGTYTVTITDANNCTFILTELISEPSILSLSINQQDISCAGGSDGTIGVLVSGGVSPYTYSWAHDPAETNNVLSGLTAGNYFLTVTDDNGNNETSLIKLSEPAPLLADAVIADASCQGEANGTITLNVSGGTTPYTYLWSNGETSSSINNLSSNNYALTITDAKGCTITENYTIEEPLELAITFTKQDVTGNGLSNGSIDLTVSGGTTPYTYSWSNGMMVEDLNNLSEGIYDILVTDANACTASESIFINSPNVLLVQVSKTDVDCFGASTGAITLTVSGGVPNYTFNWQHDASATTASVSNLPQGNYEVSITDANNNQVIEQVVITQPGELAIQETIVHNQCAGDQSASISTSISGGTTPYTYDWSNGVTSSTIDLLAGGTYTLTLTDANGCNQAATYTIEEPTPLALTFNKTNVSGAGGFDGAIDLTISGGTTPYTFAWAGGQVSEDLTNLMAGTYEVTVTDANQCTINETIIITSPAALDIQIAASEISCSGATDGTLTLTVNGGVTPYRYSWNDGVMTKDRSNLGEGNYQVTVTDDNGITATAAYTLIAPAVISIAANLTPASCNGAADGSIDLIVSGGTAPYTYDWSNGATTSGNNNLPKGNYSITITDANNCLASQTFPLAEPNELVLTFTKQDASGFGIANGSIDLSVQGGTMPYIYNWSNGQINQDIQNLAAANYRVTVTDENGCTKSLTIRIDEPNALTISTTKTNLNCHGDADGTIAVNVSGGMSPYTFNWSSGQMTKDLTGLSGGTYTLTVTDANGISKTETTFINEPSMISISSTLNHLLCGGVDDGSINLSLSGGTGFYTYQWSNGSDSRDLVDIAAGTYSITVTDGNGCSVNENYVLNEPQLLSASATISDVDCGGSFDGNIDLSVSGGTGSYTFLWSTGQLSEDISSLAGGDYSVTITDANGCQLINTFTIQESPTLALELEATDVSCFGEQNGTISTMLTGGTAPYQFNWSNGATSGNLDNLDRGNYQLTVTDALGCQSISFINIAEPTQLIVNATTKVAGCRNPDDGSISLSLSGGNPGYTFNWSTGETTESLQDLSTGDYAVTITDASGCQLSESFTISNSEAMLDPYFLAATPVASNTDIQFVDVSFPKPLTWHWNFGDANNSTSDLSNPVFAYANDTTTDQSVYTAQLRVSNLICTDSVAKDIRIINFRSSGTSNPIQRPEYIQVKTVNLYPNPTIDYATAEVVLNQETKVTVNLYDASGNLLETLTREGEYFYQIQIDVSRYPSGTYLVNVQAGKHQRTKKLIKVER